MKTIIITNNFIISNENCKINLEIGIRVAPHSPPVNIRTVILTTV